MRLASRGNIHLTLPGLQDRDGKMCGRTEAEQPDTFALLDACHAQAAKTDDACAQQRRGVQIVKLVGKRKHKVGTGEGELAVASGNGISGESWRVAEVFESLLAVRTGTIGAAEPRDAHAGAVWKIVAGAIHDLAHNLVTGNEAQLFRRKFAFDDMQVGAAHPTRSHAQQHVAGANTWVGDIQNLKWTV